MSEVYLTIEPIQARIAHQWRTHIQKTVTGIEKRTALFTWPRLKLNYKYALATSAEINWFKRNLFFSTDKIWGLPLWPDKTILTVQAAAAQKILAVGQTSYRHFYAGRAVIIISADSPNDYEVGLIETLAENQITLAENLAYAWPAGAQVLPLYDCRVDGKQSAAAEMLRRQTVEMEGTEAFEELRDFSYTPPATGAEQYLETDLFLARPQKRIDYDFNRPYDTLKYLGLAYTQARFAAGENELGLKAQFRLNSRYEISRFWDFFDARQGRWDSFWLPSWARDIVPAAAIGAADTEIDIEPIEYGITFFGNDIIGRHIFVQFSDKTYVCRKIIDAAGDFIELSAPLGRAVSAGELQKTLISFLYLCRFAQDEAELDYPYGRPDMAKTEASFAVPVGQTMEEPAGEGRAYFAGGIDNADISSVIDALNFSDETCASLAATLSAARGGPAGAASEMKAYFAGGFDNADISSVIDALNFSDETCASLAATLSAAREGPAGAASEMKAYFAGGYGMEDMLDSIDALNFSDETCASLAATLSAARVYLAGAAYQGE